MACARKSFSVLWSIEKFRSWIQKQEDILHSPEFTVETMNDTKWRLSISLERQSTLNCVVFALSREIDEGPKRIDLEYELSFLAEDETPLKSEKFSDSFEKLTSSHQLRIKIDSVLDKRRHEFLPQGILTVGSRMWKPRLSTAKNGRCFIRSVIGLERIMLNGIIENFSSLNRYKEKTVNLVSPSNGLSLVSLTYYVTNHGYVTFKKIPFNTKFIFTGKLFISDIAGNRRECKKLNSSSDYIPLYYDAWSEYALRATIDELIADKFLKNDTLTLEYEAAICPGIESENIEYEFPDDSHFEELNLPDSYKLGDSSNNIQQSEFADGQLGLEKQYEITTSFKDHMSSLYHDHLFSDILLQSGTENFPAHRSVLSARSPVFKKMFTTDMNEKIGGKIIILDMSPDAVRRMLLFIYTDTIDDLSWESAKEVYYASDKYEIPTLKRWCSQFIQQNLTPFNVSEIIVLADAHQDDDLKLAVQEYLLKYYREVFGSDEWKVFMES